jgi:hypothetical protein
LLETATPVSRFLRDGRRSVQDARLELIAEHQDVRWGLNPQTHFVSSYSYDRHYDRVAELNPFTFTPGQNQHGPYLPV